ncbi:NAD(P)H-binding protein [Nonomuraea sp. 3-1Str]|uniref:NAD(P)H-binding protein n=1 Tax=Nonomuraea sp. 3-1Str TaxID=2929801 RepID=UPI0028588F2D|nr:NAD(P)H-binding protein [Nonomuraea sp. 3-1Str]MDR8409450.1 NAD(P)H-binding protein [Nonomuraea sp. 3-1Str]
MTGATGNVGRHLVSLLLQAGEQVRATSRDPGRADLPGEVEVIRTDLSRAALQGADSAFLFPAAGQVRGFLDEAAKARLRHVVLLSAQAVTMKEAGALGKVHAEYERAVAGSGLPWTFLRPGAFMANDLRWAPNVKNDGVVRTPFAEAATAPIDERDIAAVAARTLLDDGHAGQAYELTGPASLTTVERVQILGEVLGRDLRLEELSPEQAREQLLTQAPAALVDSRLALFASFVGKTADVSPVVRELTGRAPHTYADWAARNAAAFR